MSRDGFERVLIPTDGSDTAARAAEAGVGGAREFGVEADGSVAFGTPHREILAFAEERGTDLVVMGTHGRTGLDRYLLGSVAEWTLRSAGVPVLTVPLPDADADEGDADASDVGGEP